ncbi:MAG: hypothetical protein EPN40_11255 [Rhodanobacteraceae bacterium]|nr:MAG: hypothetical protein EPN40_11255 [Rhodanobacteraceae bacterium]
MSKRLLCTTLVALWGGAVLALPAFAQTAEPGSAQNQSTTATASNQKPATPAQRAVPAPGSRQCIRDTGSHIPPPKGQCLPVAGNSYSREDIRRTGATDVGRALQMLDPAVTVHGH